MSGIFRKISANVAAATLIAAAPAAMAQEVTGAATLGYGSTNIENTPEGLATVTLDGTLNVKFGNGFTVGADLSFARVDIDNVDENLRLSTFGVDGSYAFSNGLSLGAFVERTEIDISDLGFDITGTNYGLTAGYAMGGLEVEAFAGRTNTDPDLPAGIDLNSFGASALYSAAPNLTFGASLIRTTLDGDGGDVDLDLIGVAAAYDLDSTWTLFGGISRTSLDIVSADITTFGLGISYDLKSVLGMSSTVSLELARSNAEIFGSDTDLDTIRIGVSVPFGGKASRVPLNSVANAIMKPSHSAISSTLIGIF